MAALRIIETIRRVALLGLRCVDSASGAAVSAGLSVRAAPLDGSGPWTAGKPTASGAFAFHRLPGLHDAAFGVPELASPPSRRFFAVIVEDRLGRYQDLGLALDLPQPRVLLLRLLPAPAAPPLPGLLCLRGGLRDVSRLDAEGRPLPAAFALIEASRTPEDPEGEMALGLADARGEFLLAMPHPDPLRPPPGEGFGEEPGSPPARTVLAEQRWPVLLRFRYQPSRLRWLRPTADGAEVLAAEQPPAGAVPELEALQAQEEAMLAPPLPAGTASPPLGLEITVPFAATATVRGAAPDGTIALLPAPPSSP